MRWLNPNSDIFGELLPGLNMDIADLRPKQYTNPIAKCNVTIMKETKNG